MAHRTHIHKHVRTHIHKHVRTHVYTHVRTHIHKHVRTHIHNMSAHVSTCVSAHMSADMSTRRWAILVGRAYTWRTLGGDGTEPRTRAVWCWQAVQHTRGTTPRGFCATCMHAHGCTQRCRLHRIIIMIIIIIITAMSVTLDCYNDNNYDYNDVDYTGLL